MLPISQKDFGRDPLEMVTILVWFTVILIMFFSKLKALQDVLIMTLMSIGMLIYNADSLFAHTRSYKVYVVLKRSLRADCGGATAAALICLLLHGMWPDASWPGAAMHLSSFVLWLAGSTQTSPVLSCGIYLGGKNLMTRSQLRLRVGAQVVGMMLAFAMFGLYYSFQFPGEGPFNHIFGLESCAGAAATFCVAAAHTRWAETGGTRKIK
eukprot:NODE_16727_length_980_cov_12.078546.p1 GENE.NODE_16727_length_980_cov_12.078546~~NODE_16727_length_980_cov_12.078546.p1  ORF type:complete len:210 (+),score=27.84 NODE_16727_length_980_cov_12.078546:110-739(+)